MEVYSTEEQQVEALKAWWKENGKAIILGAVIGLGGLFGWRHYQASVLEGQYATSQAYAQLEQSADQATATQAFIDSHSDAAYASLAAMNLAKAAVDKGDLAAAATQLQWVVDHSSDASLKSLAQVRLARVMIAQGQYDPALALLDQIKEPSWQAKVLMLKGDVLVKQNKMTEARDAYLSAQQVENLPLLQVKLDELAQ